MAKASLSPRASGRRALEGKSEARERLLDVAIEQFAEHGIANTTVAEIAARGKVTSAMVHYWFDTREKLLDAVVKERLLGIIERLWELAEADHANALELVRAMLKRMFELTAELPWLASLWVREIVQEGGLLRERVLPRIPRAHIASFGRKILEAQGRGEINAQIVPEFLFISMLGQVMLPQSGLKTWNRLGADIAIFDRAKLERHVIALLIEGLSGPRARGRRSGSGG
jgi:AcrR family transcriptional regulator